MKKLIAITLLLLLVLTACATHQPQPSKTFVIKVDGDVSEVLDGTQKHPCEGNWNFCDQIMESRGEVAPQPNTIPYIPGDDDPYSSYVHPDFNSNFLVHESEVKK